MVRESGSYLKGLWDRLNGGGSRRSKLPAGLPLPAASKKEVERIISELGRELESLEKRLQDASKARESKLRKVRGARASVRARARERAPAGGQELLRPWARTGAGTAAAEAVRAPIASRRRASFARPSFLPRNGALTHIQTSPSTRPASRAAWHWRASLS